MTLEEAFPLTKEEQHRLNELAKLPGPASTADWLAFATSIQRHLLEALADGDVTFQRFMLMSRATSLGCTTKERITLLGVAAERGLTIRFNLPRRIGRRPVYPLALTFAVVDLVEGIRTASPEDNLLSCIEAAANWLSVMRLFRNPPNVRTIQGWYIARRKGLGRATPRGRPKKAKIH